MNFSKCLCNVILEAVLAWLCADFWLAVNAAPIEQHQPELEFGNSTKPGGTCPEGLFHIDVNSLQRDIASGPVFAKPTALRGIAPKPAVPHYIFITGAAYSGTTSLYGLISTSPAATNLCAAKETCCEGGPLLMHWQQIPWNQVYNPDFPTDWQAALQVYHKFWNPKKSVFVEKTIENVKRFPHIWQALKKTGAKVSFIYLVRSKCLFKMQYMQNWKTVTKSMVETAHTLKAAGARLHVVRYEELVADPYGVARDLINFAPDLVSLDPSKNGLGVGYVPMLGDGNERSLSLTGYLKWRNYRLGIPHQQGFELAYNMEEAEWMRELGYTKQWFQRFPTVTAPA